MNCDEHEEFVRESSLYIESSVWLTGELVRISDKICECTEAGGTYKEMNMLLKHADHLLVKSQWEEKQLSMFREKHGDTYEE